MAAARRQNTQAERGGGHPPVPDRPTGIRPGDVERDPRGWGRETVESIVVAFTLALLFRAFEAEAFVIPTGSMATTLMGRHKDLACEACGLPYRVGCSAEEDDDSQRKRAELAALEAGNGDPERIAVLRRLLTDKLVSRARCPNCGAVTPLTRGPDGERGYDPRYPSFNGDRILVDKFSYDWRAPARWDVVVFKYPEDARVNYIKRLVGLPGETVTIAGGDIWTARDGEPPAIARKPPETMRGMLQLVHDSGHVARELVAAAWPPAWCDWREADAAGPHWTTADDGRSFAVSCGRAEQATLRYRHMLPSPAVWGDLRAGRPVADRAQPALVGDLQPYNPESTGPHWVGDLALEVDLESRSDGGDVVLDLVEAGVAHTCTIALTDGSVTLTRGGEPLARGRTTVRGRGRWRVLLANVDDELTLFVDGRRVSLDAPATWRLTLDEAGAARPVESGAEPGEATPGDLAPAGITVRGADVRLAGLRVLRDVYYIASGDPAAMSGMRAESPSVSYPLAEGQFFMLGDNSAASKDGRAWGTALRPLHHVDHHLIVGRALAIFWPHAIPSRWSVPLRIFGVEVRLPSWPNFGRMGFVR